MPAGEVRDPAGLARGVLRGHRDRLVAGQCCWYFAVGALGPHDLPGRRTGASDEGRPRPGPDVPGRAAPTLTHPWTRLPPSQRTASVLTRAKTSAGRSAGGPQE
ncbi:hypothetical protein [Ornithinimicrobium kibberense]|uniref:hypothetical protein n=1 Tax=Ornithinimicrobium kibberense TaxID=282060 RepID=UPI00360C2470